MSRFSKSGGGEMPELNTSSLPDLIFSILFFFMMVTTMREVTLQVKINAVKGTQLEKLARKSDTSYLYIGQPTDNLRAQFGSGHRIQVNDKFAEIPEIFDYVRSERDKLPQKEQAFFTVSLKVDENTPMGIITDAKMVLRKAYALKIVYSADKDQK